MPEERRLAAIMFTDIVGYTTLMGSDEDRAFEVLRKYREIHSAFISQFNGKLITEIGDGMLISFDLASDTLIGEKNEAINSLKCAVNPNAVNYPWYNETDPFLENIRGEACFKRLTEMVKHELENFDV
jgi:class 3 adenylate cyclase